MDERSGDGAGNGLLDRRWFLRSAAAGGALMLSARAGAATREAWMHSPGTGMSDTGAPSPHEAHRKRIAISSQPGTTGAGVSRTPLQLLEGIVTPSRLHFERHHSGIPDIDPGKHRLYLHGLVERPLAFSIDALHRYPTESRFRFLECSGNSGAMIAPEAVDASCGDLHGLISTSEWGGVPLAVLLDEAGVKPGAKWLIADGADAAMMSRSIPLEKARDDAIVALYQNGEPLRPSNGYPLRLLLPGWEGNMSVKWLRSLRLAAEPAMTKDETSKYSDLGADGRATLFTFPMGVKSLITNPSPGLSLGPRGTYRVSGMAWSGAGRIRQVDVSADGGGSWTEAVLDEPVLSKCAVRFQLPWRWDGSPAVIMSRAIDEHGTVQPTRDAVLAGRASNHFYHYNGIQAWRIDAQGTVRNVYA